MRIQDLLTIYDYNYWATGRILSTCANVTPEQFLAPTAHSYGSLRGTLAHTLDAEYGWRMLCQHNTSTPILDEAAFPTLDALQQRWREEGQAMRDYLAGLSDNDLVGYVRFTTDEGQSRERILWHCLFHVVNHGMQHRSEAAAILTGYGASPGEIDFTAFLNEMEIISP
jgi:uncharacterized damage-inducible protein DinB